MKIQQPTIWQINISAQDFCLYLLYYSQIVGPRGLMDKASDFGSEDCEFESRRGRYFIIAGFDFRFINVCKEQWNIWETKLQ